MSPEHVVCDVQITENGRPYTATYYVEHGIIIAKFDNRIIRVPLGMVDPDKTVRALLAASIQRAARLSKTLHEWSSATADTPPRGRGRPKLVQPDGPH